MIDPSEYLTNHVAVHMENEVIGRGAEHIESGEHAATADEKNNMSV